MQLQQNKRITFHECTALHFIKTSFSNINKHKYWMKYQFVAGVKIFLKYLISEQRCDWRLWSKLLRGKDKMLWEKKIYRNSLSSDCIHQWNGKVMKMLKRFFYKCGNNVLNEKVPWKVNSSLSDSQYKTQPMFESRTLMTCTSLTVDSKVSFVCTRQHWSTLGEVRVYSGPD